jgi:hypothetical protein
MSGNRNTKSKSSIDDDDIYNTADGDLKDMKDVNISEDDSSNNTVDLFSSSKDEDEEMANGVRKLPSTQRTPRSLCCICQRFVTPLIFVVFIILFFIYYFGDSSTIKKIPGASILFANEDLGEQYVWKGSTGSGGLTLNIINALDTQWYTYFDTAVSDWDNGSPDALTLTSEVASAPDPDCTMIDGVLKMCNSNYGNTDWIGINEVIEYDGQLAASVGKMNDHFFGTVSLDDHAKRQYTMCHEMGHGFGLPHTDTAMWNRNTGNCLDYTNRPRSNMRPGQFNYDRLVAVYGTVDNTTTAAQGNTTPTGSSTSSSSNTANDDNTNISTNPPTSNGGSSNNNNNNKNKNHQNSGNRRHRRRHLVSSNPPKSHRTIPTFVLEQLQQIRDEYHGMTDISNRRYLISSSSTVSSSITTGNDRNHHQHLEDYYKIDLGSGYTVHLHFLKRQL